MKNIYETTWFNLVLHGLRTSFNRVIQSSTSIDFAFTDRYKELLLKKTANKLAYPYAFIVVNDIDTVKDQINTSSMSRRGLGVAKAHGDAVPVTYVFPFKMNFTLNVLDSDVNSLFSIVQSIFLSDACRGFNFGIKAFESFSKIKVAKTGGISFNDATISTDQENDFGTGHITCSFEVQGWMGFSTLHPTVKTLNVKVHTLDTHVEEDQIDQALSDATLNYTYQLSVTEDADGTVHTNKLFIPVGR
jgi:hypothetical protein